MQRWRRTTLRAVISSPRSHTCRYRSGNGSVTCRRACGTAIPRRELYALKRGLQIARKLLPADTPDVLATNYRAERIEEIGTWRWATGKSPDDNAIAEMLKRYVLDERYVTRTLEGDLNERVEFHQIQERLFDTWKKRFIDPWNKHHDFPQQWWNPERKSAKSAYPFSKAAREVFKVETYPLPRNDHWNKEHAKYNQLVREALDKYLKENNITRRKMRRMSTKEAERLYKTVVVENPNRDVQKFRLKRFCYIFKHQYRRTTQKGDE